MPPRWECCKPWRNFRAHSTVTQPSWKFLVAQAFLPVSVRRKRRADSDVGVPKFDADRNVCATFVTASRRAHGQNPARYRTDRAEPGECAAQNPRIRAFRPHGNTSATATRFQPPPRLRIAAAWFDPPKFAEFRYPA